MKKGAIIAVALLALLVGGAFAAYELVQDRVVIKDYERPVAIDSAPTSEIGETVLVTSVGLPMATIRQTIENEVPRTLWSIDRRMDNCVPRKNIKVLGAKLGRTPKVKCRVNGDVRRGAIALTGKGSRLIARIPVNATFTARDIGGVIEQETATASAQMEVAIRLSVGRDWKPRAKLDLNYRWTREPGIDLLGQRITFTEPADRELRKVLREVERAVQREIGKIAIRPQVETLWSQGFAVIPLSDENPPVWLSIAPQRAGIGRFRVAGKQLLADVLVAAETEVKVGERPDDPAPKPLGPNVPVQRSDGFSAQVPVLAEYAQLSPVIARELDELAAKGLEREDLGRIELAFSDIELFATEDGRVAVGATVEAEPIGKRTGRNWGQSKGKVWLTGKPVTEAGSELVSIEDLQVFGDMDTTSGDVLIRIMQMEEVRSAIEAALVEDFRADYERILGRVKTGLSEVQAGDLTLRFDLDSIDHGAIDVTGAGLFMPIEAQGSVMADIRM